MPTDRAAEACVYCRQRPAHPTWRPFCSERCRMLDLAAWADGRYRVPGPPLPDPEVPGSPSDEDP